MKGFGFVDLMKKLGIERRVFIFLAHDIRTGLDPFLPQSPNDVAKIRSVMSEVQMNFINAVVEGRKGKLHGKPEEFIYRVIFWSGVSAQKLGVGRWSG